MSRSAITAGRTAVIAFGTDATHLVLSVTVGGGLPEDGIAAARLMDSVVADGRVVRIRNGGR